MFMTNKLRPDDIWDMDETVFCLGPKKSPTIALKRSKTYEVDGNIMLLLLVCWYKYDLLCRKIN